MTSEHNNMEHNEIKFERKNNFRNYLFFLDENDIKHEKKDELSYMIDIDDLYLKDENLVSGFPINYVCLGLSKLDDVKDVEEVISHEHGFKKFIHVILKQPLKNLELKDE